MIAKVGRVVLEHVHHVVEVDEGVVDGDHLSALGDRCVCIIATAAATGFLRQN